MPPQTQRQNRNQIQNQNHVYNSFYSTLKHNPWPKKVVDQLPRDAISKTPHWKIDDATGFLENSHQLQGFATHRFTIKEDGFYQFTIKRQIIDNKPNSNPSSFVCFVDGVYVADVRQKPQDGNHGDETSIILPYLKSGTHKIKWIWHNRQVKVGCSFQLHIRIY